MEQQGEIVLYQPETPNSEAARNETVWLNAVQLGIIIRYRQTSHYQTSEKYLQQQ